MSGYRLRVVYSNANGSASSPEPCVPAGRPRPSRGLATIARHLGIDFISVSGDAWKDVALAPVPFLAADANGGDVVYCGAEDALQGRVLLTGYESGKIWKKRFAEPNDRNITRPDQSGLSLSESRLWANCLHLPLPFMGIRQVEDINAIGRSEQMAAWDVGGNYNKPIPRWIVEEAGIPRDMFAVKKLGVSVRLSSPDVLRSARIRDDYYEWLREHTAAWLRSGRLPPQAVSALARPFQPAAGTLAGAVRRAERRLNFGTDIGRRLKLFATRDYIYKFLFPWALRRAESRYESGRQR